MATLISANMTTQVIDSDRIAFRYASAPPGSDVFVAGSFNSWSHTAHRLKERESDGVYELELALPRAVHHYKFIVNGTWCSDLNSSAAMLMPDGLGGYNNVIDTRKSNLTISPKTRPTEQCYATFRVTAHTKPGETIRLCGNTWGMGSFKVSRGIELVTDPDNYPVWTTAKPLLVSTFLPLQYRYALFSGGKFRKWDSAGCRVEKASLASCIFIDVFGVRSESRSLLLSGTPKRRVSKEGYRVPSSHDHDAALVEKASEIKEELREATKEMELHVKYGSMHIVTYRLPILLSKVGSEWFAEWDTQNICSQSEGSVSNDMDVTWVGTVIYTQKSLKCGADPNHPTEHDGVRAACAKLRCQPIFIDQELADDCYLGYCKSVLWPLFHNVLEVYDVAFDRKDSYSGRGGRGEDDATLGKWWAAYKEVNLIFARHLLAKCAEFHERNGGVHQPTVWVHGYHMMLIPRILQELYMEYVLRGGKTGHAVLRHAESTDKMRSLADALLGSDQTKAYQYSRPHVVFFLHEPMPTFEVFRTLGTRVQLVEGILGSDMVGFHSFDHARHFLTACRRSVGVAAVSRKGGNLGVQYMDRNVMITVSHVGIEPLLLTKEMESDASKEVAAQLQAKYPGKQLLVGVDFCDRIRGVALKLLAWEKALKEHPDLRNRAVMVQRCLGSRAYNARAGDIDRSVKELQFLANRVNEMCGTTVVDLEIVSERDFTRAHRIGLSINASLYVHTPVREGLNLQPLEFTFVSKMGIAVVSEFSGCCSVLNGAVRVMPFNVLDTANKIVLALNMSDEEKRYRRERDRVYIAHSSASWTKQVLTDMWIALRKDGETVNMDTVQTVGAGIVYNESQQRLTSELLKSAFKRCPKRFIMVDHGGTLVRREAHNTYLKTDFQGSMSKDLGEKMRRALAALASNPHNSVFVISGNSSEELEDSLAGIDGLGMVSESGLCWSWPPVEGHAREWQSAVLDEEEASSDWRAITLRVMEVFTWRTNGTSIQSTYGTIKWKYRLGDPEWGSHQASNLAGKLHKALAGHNVTVVMNRSSVEVMPHGLDSGLGLRNVLNDYVSRYGCQPRLFMCVGDDLADEYMYNALYEYAEDNADSLKDAELITATVGRKASCSRYWLNHVDDVEELLCSVSALP